MARKPSVPKTPAPKLVHVATGLRKESANIFSKKEGAGSLLSTLIKVDPDGASNMMVATGERHPPFDMKALYDLKVANIHHSACLRAKRQATVGLGWSKDVVAEKLDPLCRVSWHDTLTAVCDDFWTTGGGWLEVVRKGGAIRGLHHVKSKDACFVIEDRINHHYAVQGEISTGRIIFAPFGESADFSNSGRKQRLSSLGLGQTPEGEVNELIYFRQPSADDPYFGWPDYLASVPSIELVQMNHMDRFDFHNNRGVPEFIFLVYDPNIDSNKWAKVENALKSNIGLGNKHKTFAMQFTNTDARAEIHKLAMESDASSFESENNALALEIVSAHGVPPLLAGIQIPGKLGANNELPNALMAFQTLMIGQAQLAFEQTLAVTLGDPARNGSLGLTRQDFLGKMVEEVDPVTGAKKTKKVGGLRTILDEIDLGVAATVGGMRKPIAQAQAEGRDPKDGLKD
jgi:hypothetical protein